MDVRVISALYVTWQKICVEFLSVNVYVYLCVTNRKEANA